jgi:threonine dehydratase
MILVAVDDLMLASKIRHAAVGARADLAFPRSPAEIVERVRLDRPTLVIFDLDSSRLEPLSTIAGLKADGALASIPTIAFVSHVQADLLAAARAAGVDRVLARAAFFERLPEILATASGGPQPGVRRSASGVTGQTVDAGRRTPDTGPLSSSPDIALRNVSRAHERIAPCIRRTPLVESAWLSSIAHADVRLKLESLQVTNSFKPRGMFNMALSLVERLTAGTRAPVLVTASAGNAGRALAYAAERLGLHTIVFTPRDAPRTKLDAIRRHGADLRAEADSYEDGERRAKAYAAQNGLPFISPFSHPDLIAGFGTVALEVFEEFPGIDAFVVPVGGGGLISGIGLAAKAVSRDVRIVGVEVEASHPFAVSVREGRITEVMVGPTIADGLAGNIDPDTITFDLVRRYVDELTQVSEDDLAEGIRGLAAQEHLIAEGAGIAGVAAVLAHRVDLKGRRVAVVVSGSNIDIERLRAILG